MNYRVRRNLMTGLVMFLSLSGSVMSTPPDPAARAVSAFYKFHLARNKDFTVANLRVRRRWLSPELYKLLLGELKREAEQRKTHPDEAPYFEGDPLTNSQEYPDSFRVGKTENGSDLAKVTVTMVWSPRTSRGRDQRDIVVEVKRTSTGWLINDIIDNQGSRLQDELKRPH